MFWPARPAFAFFAVLLSLGLADAADISLAQAKQAAGKWLERNQRPLNADVGGMPVAGKTYGRADGTPLFHVVRLSEGGFVVTSADDGIDPIIAVSDGDDLVVDDNNPLWVLLNKDMDNRRKSMELERAQTAANPLMALADLEGAGVSPEAQWADLLAESDFTLLQLASVGDVRVSPMVQSKWNQLTVSGKNVYNYYTPNNWYCGCVATAMAQVMRYHQFPTASMSPVLRYYYTNGVQVAASTYGGVYSWSDMPLVPTSAITDVQRQAIGKLTRDAGVSVCMNYTASGSGASAAHTSLALKDTFGYSNAIGVYFASNPSTTQIQNGILANLDAGCPVLLGIQGGANGHAVVGDGYGYSSSTLYVHLNMGWGGADDAWYNLPTVDDGDYNFDTISALVFNAYPTGTGELLTGRVVDGAGNPVSGATITAKRGQTTFGTATSGANGIYAMRISVNQTLSYTVTATLAGQSSSLSVSLSPSTSTKLAYPTTYYTPNAGAIGNNWGNNFTFSLPATPTGVAATDGSSTDNVTVTWSAAAYATSYEVWRGTSTSSTLAVKIVSGITATTYSDGTASPGVTYYYWVKAVNAVGTSGFSVYDAGLRAEVTETSTTPVPVPYVWLDAFNLVSGSDYEAAGHADVDGDGFAAWEEYVAGTVPTNRASLFLSDIVMVNGAPVIVWTPDLGAARIYSVLGKTNLVDAAWVTPTNAATRFFRVGIDMN